MKTGNVLWDIELADYKARLLRDDGPAGREGQSDRGHLRRRLSDARISRRLRSRERQADLAVLHRPGTRRARQRDMARISRVTGARRRRHMGDRQLRSRIEHALLGHRQSQSRLLRRGSQRRQPVHLLADRGRRRHRHAEVALPVHPARHCTTGTRTTCRCWPTSPLAASVARS